VVPKLINTLFLALICGLPLGQAAMELARGESVQALEVFGPVEETRLRTFEKNLREASFAYRKVTPWYQLLLLEVFGRGNEKTIVGNDGWLFFTENLDFITRPAFGQAGEEAIRNTIEDFGRQLEERGVALVVVPAPAKVAIQPENLSRWTHSLSGAQSARVRELFESITTATVWDSPKDQELEYLPRDTHWTPGCMHRAAHDIASLARKVLNDRGLRLERQAKWTTKEVTIPVSGDLTDMLRLPDGLEAYDPMELRLEQVVDAGSGRFFVPDRDAEVLLLGDSFTQVFSDPQLSMGEHAGFAEHLALELGAPLDVIALAGGSARAVREALARREEGLAGKKLVIWQISNRDFIGDPTKWVPVELPSGGVSAGEITGPVRVRAEIVELTRIPDEFEYEFCLAIHEYRVLEVLEGTPPPGPLWVAHVAIEDFEPTPQATFEIGQEHILELEDVALHHDLEDTSWMDLTDSDPRATIWLPTTIEAANK
jgi:hypothetical protein